MLQWALPSVHSNTPVQQREPNKSKDETSNASNGTHMFCSWSQREDEHQHLNWRNSRRQDPSEWFESCIIQQIETQSRGYDVILEDWTEMESDMDDIDILECSEDRKNCSSSWGWCLLSRLSVALFVHHLIKLNSSWPQSKLFFIIQCPKLIPLWTSWRSMLKDDREGKEWMRWRSEPLIFNLEIQRSLLHLIHSECNMSGTKSLLQILLAGMACMTSLNKDMPGFVRCLFLTMQVTMLLLLHTYFHLTAVLLGMWIGLQLIIVSFEYLEKHLHIKTNIQNSPQWFMEKILRQRWIRVASVSAVENIASENPWIIIEQYDLIVLSSVSTSLIIAGYECIMSPTGLLATYYFRE